MAQFSVYRNPRPAARHAPFLLEVQSELVPTVMRVVVPLVRPDYFGPAARTLNPVLVVEGDPYVMAPTEIGSLPRQQLGTPVGDLRHSRQEILGAIDFMLNGF